MSWSKIFEPYMHQSSGTSPSIIVGISRNTTCIATFGPPRLLFEEDFSEGIPSTWQVVDGGSGGGAASTWTTANPGNRNFGPPFVEPFAIVDSDAAGSGATQDEQLITPSISVEPCPGNPRKVFISFSDYMKGLERERADVALSVDGTSWVRKEGFDNPALEVDSYRCRGVGMAAQGSVGPLPCSLRWRRGCGHAIGWPLPVFALPADGCENALAPSRIESESWVILQSKQREVCDDLAQDFET
ncbi:MULTISPECIES: hypothetical protein [Caldilinea]|uniref:hypothetical protein n=1 Tax=Caldilinea TaxID=233191 RepID=UPI0005C54891|nr:MULTISPECIES: hypothetical protein [Caldilinea]GIV73905.1 MAG: hypothetical protein KatS3mg049_2461 [Caldilinea sp.]